MKTSKIIGVVTFVGVVLVAIFGFRKFKPNDYTSVIPTPTKTDVSLPVNAPYSFAVISDIHSDLKNLQRTLDRIQMDKMNFIIVDGDLTTLGKAEEMLKVKTVLDQSEIPYYVLPGNHDLYSARKNNNPFQDIFGVDYQSFLKDNVKFILIDNADGVVGIDKTQQSWIENQIKDCPKLYCLVFAHMPINHAVLKHIMGEESPVVASQAANLVKEFVGAKVNELFAGHIHFLSTYTLDGLKTTTDGVIWGDNGKSLPRFVEVKVSQPETRIEVKQVWLE